MKSKLIAIIFLTNIIGAGIFSADSHEDVLAIEEELVNATKELNKTANRGEWEKHFSYIASESSAFFAVGMLSTIYDESQIEEKIQGAREWNNKGGGWSIQLHDVQARVYGDTSVVTCYRTGSLIISEQNTVSIHERVSLVWNKREDGWKVVHAHISELKEDYND